MMTRTDSSPDLARQAPVFSRILVAMDGLPAAGHAVDLAMRLAASFRSAVRIVYVLDADRLAAELTAWAPRNVESELHTVALAAEKYLRDTAANVRPTGLEVETAVLSGDVVEQLLVDAARWHADLIVMGTHARAQTAAPALGSKPAELLRKAAMPVLIVR